MKFRTLVFFLLSVGSFSPLLPATDLIFNDGRVESNVIIERETSKDIFVRGKYGSIKYPKKSIRGVREGGVVRPVGGETPSSSPSGGAAVIPGLDPDVFPQPTPRATPLPPADEYPIPQATPLPSLNEDPSPQVGTPEAPVEPPPLSPDNVTVEIPVPPETTVGMPDSGTEDASPAPLPPSTPFLEPTPLPNQEPLPTPTPLPNLSPTTPLPSDEPAMASNGQKATEGGPPAPPFDLRFPFELVLFLAFITLWMRSLQWVQKDLCTRRTNPHPWIMLALFVPCVGAGIYALLRKSNKLPAPEAPVHPAPATRQFHGPRRPSGPKHPPIPHESAAPAPHTPAAPHPDPVPSKTPKGFEYLDLSEKKSLLAENADLVAGFKPVGEILDEAISDGASDIHIEPASSDYRVRFRINSLLHERNHYPVSEGRRIVALLKAVSEMDPTECAKSQEGRFRLRSSDREIEFRLATSETIHGGKLVLRLMERTKEILDLDALGIQETHMNLLQEVLPMRSGLVVVAGPTGSGTTSTLYAMLARLDAKTRNIMTVEDPTEYELPGTTQISVNPKSDITFASGLKSILRQDPDVIFVGELRDRETAGMVATASLEHLVFTSLQSSGVLDVLESLRGLGIEPYQLAATLRLIIAQRRVRVLCKHCRQPYEAEGNELESVGIAFEPGSILYAATGCENCRDSGFSGWTGLFEFLPVGGEIAQALADGHDASSIMAAAARGFRTFNHDGAQKVLLGITTVQEVIGTN